MRIPAEWRSQAPEHRDTHGVVRRAASPKSPARISFTIGRLAQLTGFTTTLIRVWERRHAFLEPERLDNGHRRYTARDLGVLQRVRALLDQGVRIGDIARMGRQELLAGHGEASPPPTEQSPALPHEDYLDGRHPEIAWSILDALPCAVIVTDKRGLVRWVNRGVAVLCGYDLAELHGLKPGSVLQGPGTDRKAVEQLRTAITNQRPGSVTILNYHKSGEPYLAMVELTPLGVGVNHLGFVATARRVPFDVAAASS
ncbi:MAG: MerR family transcriptional regulator [Myxococcales bacterium]|jgi:PAS domain S-box-containing protein